MHGLDEGDLVRVEVFVCEFLVVVFEIDVKHACENAEEEKSTNKNESCEINISG